MTQESLNRTNAFNAGKRQNRADLHNWDKNGQSYSNAICWGIMSSPANGRRDDVKSVRNPVRSAKWWTEQFHCFSFCLRMTDKRQKATKVKCTCKRKESLTKQSIFVEQSLPWKKRLTLPYSDSVCYGRFFRPEKVELSKHGTTKLCRMIFPHKNNQKPQLDQMELSTG